MSSAPDSPSPASERNPAGRWERLTLIHVGMLGLLVTWAFGGAAPWARTLVAAWASLGAVITLAALRLRAGRARRSPLAWLWPVAALNGLVLLSCLNPSFELKHYGPEALLAYTGARHAALPSTAHPATSLAHLWLFDAIYLACFNLALLVQHRRALRLLILVLVGNGALLAVFGTFQHLVSDGLYFGLVPSPNTRCFATFVYGNHWSAYVALLLAAGTGLAFHFWRREVDLGLSRSPVIVGVLGLFLIAITPALAGSRAGILLVLVVGLAAAARGLRRVVRDRRQHGEPVAGPVTAGLLVAGLAIGSAAYLGEDALQERWHDTTGQWRSGLLAERLQLYADTWRIAAQQPAFGWGLGCYDKVLLLVRPRPLEANRQYEHSYVDAHSDWLQALAEIGWLGTALVGLTVVLPLRSVSRGHLRSNVTAYLLGGCGLVLLYAAVEFPFGNPAVVVTWWICFFSGLQYARLRRRESSGFDTLSSP